jgi:hypothetical protein
MLLNKLLNEMDGLGEDADVLFILTIKELRRRAAQFQFELGREPVLQQAAVDGAIEEMVFTGGALNLTLLGGSSALSAM